MIFASTYIFKSLKISRFNSVFGCFALINHHKILNNVILHNKFNTKTMKTLFFTIALFTTVMISAQTYETENKQIYQEILNGQVEELSLTGEQKQPFIDLSNKYFDKIIETRQSDVSRMSKFKTLKKLQEEKDTEVENMLSKEQFKKYKELQKKNRKKLKSVYKQRNG